MYFSHSTSLLPYASFFTTHGWKWENRNTHAILACMSDVSSYTLLFE